MAESSKERLMRLVLALALVALVTWEYAPALRGGFVYEDAVSTEACGITMNNAGRLGTQALWCWQLNRGQSAQSFHVVNLGLHFLVTAGVGALVWRLTGQPAAALAALLVFAVNAVGVESVAYLTGRSELISAAGVVGACLAALSGQWVAMVGLVVIGWCGKETASVAVMLIPLCLWYQRGRRWGWVAALGGVLLGLAMLWLTRAWWWPGGPSRGAWALLQSTAVVRVTLLSVLPFGQTIDYDYARVPVAMQVCAAVFLLAGLLWAWSQRANRLLLCGVAWVACAVAPRLIVPTPASVFSEHQFYLPLVGMAIILASLVEPHGHYRAAL